MDLGEAIITEIQVVRARSRRLPVVTLSYAQSLDGCIAARRGECTILSGPQSKRMTHQLRAAHDAILVGIGTVLADDPRLTARLAGGRNPQPVVLDGRLRFPAGARLVQGSPWIATTEASDPVRRARMEQNGTRLFVLPGDAYGRVDLPALLACLGELGVRSLMVEGGAAVIGSFLRAQLVDFIALTVAPLYLNGLPAVDGGLGGVDYPRLLEPHFAALGADLIVWGRPSWGGAGAPYAE